MPTRLEQIQQMLEKEPNDTFLLYGLAMEQKKAGNADEALKLLQKVAEIDPMHGYSYFQSGQILQGNGDLAGAKLAYEKGIAAADKSGDAHAGSELRNALSDLLQQD